MEYLQVRPSSDRAHSNKMISVANLCHEPAFRYCPSVARNLTARTPGASSDGQSQPPRQSPRHARRTKSVSLVDDVADNTFSLLVRDKRKLAFKPMPGSTSHVLPSEESEGRAEYSRTHPVRRGRLASTRLNPENLQRRLLALQRDAKALEDEQGINVLFLAMGFLKWFEKSEFRHRARSPSCARFRSHWSGTMLVPRCVWLCATPISRRISRFRKSSSRILVSCSPISSEIEDWMPASYFAQVAQAVEAQPRWSIDGNGMFLGFFSFSKLLMFRDLVAESWPGQSILSHPLLDGLLQSGFPAAAPLFPDDAKLDEVIDTASLIQVVDADASQSLVAEAVRAGRDLVVQGPPGTGKSQTITNIIAGAVHDGKTVLFVAEKMAALNVVHDRLAKAGLEPVCLELHSRKVSKRAVHSALERTLNTTIAARPGDELVNRLRTIRDRLNSDDALLHSPLLPRWSQPVSSARRSGSPSCLRSRCA